MSKRRKRESRELRKKSKPMIFLKTLIISLIVFSGTSAFAIIGYSVMNEEIKYSPTLSEIENDKSLINYGIQTSTSSTSSNLTNTITNYVEPINQHTNFLIMGTDDGGTRSDVLMIGSFNADSSNLDLISIPRDTKMQMGQDRIDVLKSEGKYVPSGGYMEINKVMHYSGEEHGIEFTVIEIEEMFNIDIEYYVNVNLDAFRYLVDAIGGVEFNVPQRMYYTDPYQDLYIDLQAGLQTLNGTKAEGLVRFRDYGMADLQRVKVQQDFLYALITQLLNTKNFFTNATAMLDTFTTYVDTNFKISDAPKYIKYLENLSPANINTHTIPYDLVSGQVYINEEESRTLIEQVFYNEGTKRDIVDVYELQIEVLNGSNENGLASKTGEWLEEAGYTVVSIGDSNWTADQATRIVLGQNAYDTMDLTILSQRKVTEDELNNKDLNELINYFPNHDIILDNNMKSDKDVIIVLGLDQ